MDDNPSAGVPSILHASNQPHEVFNSSIRIEKLAQLLHLNIVSNRNIMSATYEIFKFLVVTLKKSRKQLKLILILYFI